MPFRQFWRYADALPRVKADLGLTVAESVAAGHSGNRKLWTSLRARFFGKDKAEKEEKDEQKAKGVVARFMSLLGDPDAMARASASQKKDPDAAPILNALEKIKDDG